MVVVVKVCSECLFCLELADFCECYFPVKCPAAFQSSIVAGWCFAQNDAVALAGIENQVVDQGGLVYIVVRGWWREEGETEDVIHGESRAEGFDAGHGMNGI